MIHYYILSRQIQDTSAHGRHFRALMCDINRKFGRNITVTHKIADGEGAAKMADTRRRWRVVALIDYSDGSAG